MSRRRRRASDLATVRPTKGLGSLVLLAVGLTLVVLYKVGVSEETAGFFTEITGDPELQLPPSVLDRVDGGAGAVDAAAATGSSAATADAAAPTGGTADATTPDAATPDAATPDAGPSDAPTDPRPPD